MGLEPAGSLVILKTTQGRYRVKVKRNGVIVFDKTFERKRDAEIWETDRKREVMNSDFIHPSDGKKTLADIYPEWLLVRKSKVAIRTLNSDQSAWRAHIKDDLGNRPLSDLTPGEIDGFAARVRTGVQGTTTNRILATLHSLLNYAVRKRLITTNPAHEVRVKATSNHQHVVVELPQMLAIVAAQREVTEYADVTLFLGLTGMRWGELVALRVQDIVQTIDAGWVVRVSKNVVRASGGGEAILQNTTKGGGSRYIPLLQLAHETATKWSEGKALDDLLFPAPNGTYLDPSNWRRLVHWKTTVPEGFRIHDLRHSAATALLKSNADVLAVQGILGHSESSTTLRYYGHVTGGDHLRSGMDRMGDSLAAALKAAGGDSGATVIPLASAE